jgi:hypothetical protein
MPHSVALRANIRFCLSHWYCGRAPALAILATAFMKHLLGAGAASKRGPAFLFARWAGQFDLTEIVSAPTRRCEVDGPGLAMTPQIAGRAS